MDKLSSKLSFSLSLYSSSFSDSPEWFCEPITAISSLDEWVHFGGKTILFPRDFCLLPRDGDDLMRKFYLMSVFLETGGDFTLKTIYESVVTLFVTLITSKRAWTSR